MLFRSVRRDAQPRFGPGPGLGRHRHVHRAGDAPHREEIAVHEPCVASGPVELSFSVEPRAENAETRVSFHDRHVQVAGARDPEEERVFEREVADGPLAEDRVVGHYDELSIGDGRRFVLAELPGAGARQEICLVHRETGPNDEGSPSESRIGLERPESGH